MKKVFSLTVVITLVNMVWNSPQVALAVWTGDTLDVDPAYVMDQIKTIRTDGGRVDWSHSGNNLIAFDAIPSGETYYDVYTMTPTGTNETCLTCTETTLFPEHNGNPAWYPDRTNGDYMLFQAQDPDLTDSNYAKPGQGINNNLWIAKVGSGSFWQLTAVDEGEAALHPHFSNDGSKLAWATRQNVGGQYYWALVIADFGFDGQGVPYTSNSQVYMPYDSSVASGSHDFYETHNFSSDDSKILFTATDNAHTEFYLYEFTIATEEVSLLAHSTGEWNEHAHYRPNDDSMVVWVTNKNVGGLTAEYWKMNPSSPSTTKTRWTYFNSSAAPEYLGGGGSNAFAGDFSWSPNGQYLMTYIQDASVTSNDNAIVIIKVY